MLKLVSIARAANRRVGDARHYDRLTAMPEIETTLVIPHAAAAVDHPIASDETLRALDLRFAQVRMPRLAGWSDGLHTLKGLREILRELRPDVIHVQEEPHTLLAYQAASLRDRVLPDAALVLETEQSAAQMPPSALRLTERATHAKADVLIVRHRGALEARRLRGFNGHGVIIEHAVDRTIFRPGARDAARRALGAGGSSPGLTIGYVGRLSPEGGLIEVLEAVAACRADVQVLIMGRGEIRDELADRAFVLKIHDRVRFFDPKGQQDVAFFLNALDVLVAITRPTPGVRDPFDRTIAEAQSCGVPVIASDHAALPDVVGDGGWTVDAGDAGMLAQLLTRLAQEPSAIADAAARGLRQAECRFDQAIVAHELQRALQTAYARRASRAAEHGARVGQAGAMPQRVEP